ncbi:hypothetical protein [uncultured Algibacter sp.]|uniref:hypothetical protein n=1 Tax=uncultured Algibacter sp. TaxID=298659 RepID=UPI00261A38A8|nr:hypothetical protein [uncultured Algibacter sp.]
MRVFKEEQRFTQTWLIILLSISSMIPIFLITKLFYENQMSLNQYIGTMTIVLISMGLIFIFKLKTRIDESGIHYQFFPFHLKMKTILWKHIKKAKTRKYDAISEFGGWGLKGGWLWKKNNGIAINVKGNIGIQLELKNGKKVLIGTQKKHDADSVIERYLYEI